MRELAMSNQKTPKDIPHHGKELSPPDKIVIADIIKRLEAFEGEKKIHPSKKSMYKDWGWDLGARDIKIRAACNIILTKLDDKLFPDSYILSLFIKVLNSYQAFDEAIKIYRIAANNNLLDCADLSSNAMTSISHTSAPDVNVMEEIFNNAPDKMNQGCLICKSLLIAFYKCKESVIAQKQALIHSALKYINLPQIQSGILNTFTYKSADPRVYYFWLRGEFFRLLEENEEISFSLSIERKGDGSSSRLEKPLSILQEKLKNIINLKFKIGREKISITLNKGINYSKPGDHIEISEQENLIDLSENLPPLSAQNSLQMLFERLQKFDLKAANEDILETQEYKDLLKLICSENNSEAPEKSVSSFCKKVNALLDKGLRPNAFLLGEVIAQFNTFKMYKEATEIYRLAVTHQLTDDPQLRNHAVTAIEHFYTEAILDIDLAKAIYRDLLGKTHQDALLQNLLLTAFVSNKDYRTQSSPTEAYAILETLNLPALSANTPYDAKQFRSIGELYFWLKQQAEQHGQIEFPLICPDENFSWMQTAFQYIQNDMQEGQICFEKEEDKNSEEKQIDILLEKLKKLKPIIIDDEKKLAYEHYRKELQTVARHKTIDLQAFFKILDRMIIDSFPPNAFIFGLIICFLNRLKMFEKAISVYHWAIQHNALENLPLHVEALKAISRSKVHDINLGWKAFNYRFDKNKQISHKVFYAPFFGILRESTYTYQQVAELIQETQKHYPPLSLRSQGKNDLTKHLPNHILYFCLLHEFFRLLKENNGSVMFTLTFQRGDDSIEKTLQSLQEDKKNIINISYEDNSSSPDTENNTIKIKLAYGPDYQNYLPPEEYNVIQNTVNNETTANTSYHATNNTIRMANNPHGMYHHNPDNVLPRVVQNPPQRSPRKE